MAADDVELVMAHHFPADRCDAVGAEVRDYLPGDTMVVRRPYARSIINAGLAQVDPADRLAVERALARAPQPKPPVATKRRAPAAKADTPAE